jgi:hypothetical protein
MVQPFTGPLKDTVMRPLPRLLLLAATMAAGPCYAVDMGLRSDQFGDAVTMASMRQGTDIDWGTPVCGEPKYLSGVCVWSMTNRFDLTSYARNKKRPKRVIWAVLRWYHKNDKPVAEARTFEKMCAALIGAAKPQWTNQKVASFTKRVVSNMKKDTEIREEGLLFMFNTWPDLFTCEAEDED